ncbi:50S ribosomal protein L31e [Sulfodiicoccus acidiphilus]|uniref:Large ribosomal subunit protein eL31 n=1 Tax=Sulfodiicoccus acidiphilus TaxID=1670455 RepID=A0A348B2Z9_9CREN|nr:50S ribosomal protein L31e [Sulfodiicoccus acidiphilus]BBD72551.1 50S ribosomal protein L31e [Sulfodiicoccus acidiphilus]GGT93723.1 50S ribosomal protein L31e [Sulfodiicoccus acidiphilus]
MQEKENFEMVISLREVQTGKRAGRASRAIREIRREVRRHTGATRVIVDPLLAELVLGRGRNRCPSKVTVAISKIGEKTVIVKSVLKVSA